MNKVFLALLILVCVGLGAGWYFRHQAALKEKQADVATIVTLSNEWTQTKARLDEQQQVNITLETNLTLRQEELSRISNTLNQTRQNLAKVEADAKAAAEAAAAEVAKRDARINELESQKDDLTKQMTDLNTSITNLEGKIAETERKLAASEGDREFLLKELKRLQAEKAELEKQFNDLAVLRDQVRKLRDELAVARRLDWIRRGIYGSPMKGAEKLQKGFIASSTNLTNYNLNVELRESGEVKINTNPPPATANPPANSPVPK